MRAASYDAIVVGSRCAGAPTAMLLARQGFHVLLLDRSAVLNDPVSTPQLAQTGLVMLRRWGLLERLADTGCPPSTMTRLTLDGAMSEAPLQPVAAIAHTFAPRRRLLDTLLTDAAREAGVDVRLGHPIRDLLRHDGEVTGVIATDRHGTTFIAEAPVVVGADGAHSFVARAVRAREYRRRSTGNCVHYSYWRDVPDPDTVDLAILAGRTLAILPTHDGHACAVVAGPAAAWPVSPSAREAAYLANLATLPALWQRVCGGSRVSRLLGTSDLPNLFRQASGPGWALVGDAGLVKDPGPGRGTSDAFRQADRLAAAIGEGLSGRSTLPTALAAYGVWRDQAFGTVFDTTADLAAHPRSPEELAIGLLRHQQAITADHDQFTHNEGALV